MAKALAHIHIKRGICSGATGSTKNNATTNQEFMSAQVTESQVYFSSLHMSRHVAAAMHLGSFTADPPSQLDVLGHDSNPLGMDGTEVGVLKQANLYAVTVQVQDNFVQHS